jgi:hypothetical protein
MINFFYHCVVDSNELNQLTGVVISWPEVGMRAVRGVDELILLAGGDVQPVSPAPVVIELSSSVGERNCGEKVLTVKMRRTNVSAQ